MMLTNPLPAMDGDFSCPKNVVKITETDKNTATVR